MLTFYYLNELEIDRQYAQIAHHVAESYETTVSKRGQLKGTVDTGDLLGALGTWAPKIGGAADFEGAKTSRVLHRVQPERKLREVLKHLRERAGLEVIADSRRSAFVTVGSPLLFDGVFRLHEVGDDVAVLEGAAGELPLFVPFSRNHVAPSVYNMLSLIASESRISGYGVTANRDTEGVRVRPVAFGLNFLELLSDDALS